MTEIQKRRVLLLDDEKMLIEMYRMKLESNGYEVASFNSGYEALKALRGGYDPDVMLFDITMPDDISGYEFLERVKKEKLNTRSLKIALTNEGQDAEVARILALGADAHFLKISLIPSEVVAEVTRLLEEKNS